MAERELDALVVAGKGHWWTGRGYVRYLTDFHLWAHDALLVFPATASRPWVTSYAVAGLVAERGWVTDTGGDVFLVPRTARSWRTAASLAAGSGSSGREWVLPAGIDTPWPRRCRGRSSSRPTRSSTSCGWPRARSRSSRIARCGSSPRPPWSASPRWRGPGPTQLELSAEACRVALAGGARDLLVADERAARPYGPPADVPVAADDILRYHMEISGPSGHWCELTITLAFRPPTDAEERLMPDGARPSTRSAPPRGPGSASPSSPSVFEQTIRDDGWQLGPPTQHFDFHGQGQDVIELPVVRGRAAVGLGGDAPLPVGGIVSYHPARRIDPPVGWTPGISDNLLVTEQGGEWLSGGWDHRFREVGT